jgi:hypothetical protein
MGRLGISRRVRLDFARRVSHILTVRQAHCPRCRRSLGVELSLPPLAQPVDATPQDVRTGAAGRGGRDRQLGDIAERGAGASAATLQANLVREGGSASGACALLVKAGGERRSAGRGSASTPLGSDASVGLESVSPDVGLGDALGQWRCDPSDPNAATRPALRRGEAESGAGESEPMLHEPLLAGCEKSPGTQPLATSDCDGGVGCLATTCRDNNSLGHAFASGSCTNGLGSLVNGACDGSFGLVPDGSSSLGPAGCDGSPGSRSVAVGGCDGRLGALASSSCGNSPGSVASGDYECTLGWYLERIVEACGRRCKSLYTRSETQFNPLARVRRQLLPNAPFTTAREVAVTLAAALNACTLCRNYLRWVVRPPPECRQLLWPPLRGGVLVCTGAGRRRRRGEREGGHRAGGERAGGEQEGEQADLGVEDTVGEDSGAAEERRPEAPAARALPEHRLTVDCDASAGDGGGGGGGGGLVGDGGGGNEGGGLEGGGVPAIFDPCQRGNTKSRSRPSPPRIELVGSPVRSAPASPRGCGNPLALPDAILSQRHAWDTGRGFEEAWYLNHLIEGAAVPGPSRQERLAQGEMRVAGLRCSRCGAAVGWVFHADVEPDGRNVSQVGRVGLVVSSLRHVPPPEPIETTATVWPGAVTLWLHRGE